MIFFILSFIVVVPPSLRARTPPDSLEMEKLREEHEELQKNLRASASQSRRQADSHDAQQLRALLNRRDELNEQLERERLSQAELDREVMTFRHHMRAHTHSLTARIHCTHTQQSGWVIYNSKHMLYIRKPSSLKNIVRAERQTQSKSLTLLLLNS